jgi:hypothetical protein
VWKRGREDWRDSRCDTPGPRQGVICGFVRMFAKMDESPYREMEYTFAFELLSR